MYRFRGVIVEVCNESGYGTILLDKGDTKRFVSWCYSDESAPYTKNKLRGENHYVRFYHKDVAGYCGERLFLDSEVSFSADQEKLFNITLEKLPSRISLVLSSLLWELLTCLVFIGAAILLVLWLMEWVVYLLVLGLLVWASIITREFLINIRYSLKTYERTRTKLLRRPQN